MPRFGDEGNPGEILGSGKNVALAWDQRPAKSWVEKIFLRQLPGRDFPRLGRRQAALGLQVIGSLPGNNLLRRGGAHREAGHGSFTVWSFRGRRMLRVEASHESVFNLVRVAQNVALVEL